MGVNKVEFGGKTLVDLTKDTVNPQKLLKGATAHGANGEPINGNVVTVPTTTSLTVTQNGVSALDGTVGKTLNDKGLQIRIYVGSDEKLHFIDWTGADTVLNFNKGVSLNDLKLSSRISFVESTTYAVSQEALYLLNTFSSSSSPTILVNGSSKSCVISFSTGGNYIGILMIYLKVGDKLQRGGGVSGYGLFKIT